MSYFSRPETLQSTGYLRRELVLGFFIAALSGCLFWLVSIYASALRDPRFLDGWVLAAGMCVQLLFHIAAKMALLSPKSITRWRKVHILIGLLMISAFVSHSDFSLPDTSFEWALSLCFVLVTLSGLFGMYLGGSLRAKRGTDDSVRYDRIPIRRDELAKEVETVVAQIDPTAAAIGLPMQPHDAWIMDLYTTRLRDFFQGQRNSTAHLFGSQRPLRQLTDEIGYLSRFVDKQSQQKLETIKTLVVEKDRLDFAFVQFQLSKGWQFVHVPVTYSLIVLVVLHVVVVYAFSSGAR
jgi:hypothetical protein